MLESQGQCPPTISARGILNKEHALHTNSRRTVTLGLYQL